MQAGNPHPRLIEAMKRLDFYPDHPATVEFRQTHISCVFLAGDYVYKVKKPVHLDFLDAYTLGARYRLCREEVRLNRRFAPSVYLGVVPIIEEGSRYFLGGYDDVYHTNAREFAVKMRRLPDDLMLDRLVRGNAVTPEAIRKIATRLASIHRNAPTSRAWRYGSRVAVERAVLLNLEECRSYIGQTISAAAFDSVGVYLSGFIAAHRDQLDRRVHQGRVREGHGDLRCEHVCLNENIDIFDCVEFDEKLRYGDVASDLAFLAMDLDAHGVPHLSDDLVRAYSEQTGDPEIATLINFYKCQRACVRGKVDSIKSLAGEVPPDERDSARRRACAKFSLAEHYAAMGSPAILVVCGLVASGKSTVAEILCQRTGFEVFNSDRIRKQLAGVPENLRRENAYGAGIYTPAFDRLTYDTMLNEARQELAAGRGVILDASFKDQSHRKAVQALARRMNFPVLFVECRVSEPETLRRLGERSAHPEGISDAGKDTYLQMKKDFASITELPSHEHMVVDTTGGDATVLEQLENALVRKSRRN